MRYSARLYLCLITILILSGRGQAQHQSSKFDHIDINDGLSQVSVMSIFKDSRGFMWFGTQDGINRYDGYRFKIYSSSQDSSTLSNNFITSICEDINGNLWIGTYNGLNKLDVNKDKITRYMHTGDQELGLINMLKKTRDNKIYIGHTNGLSRLAIDQEGGEYFESQHQLRTEFGEISDKNVSVIAEDKNKTLWIGTRQHGLYQVRKKANSHIEDSVSYYHSRARDNKFKLSNDHVTGIAIDSLAQVWVGTDKGLNKLNDNGQVEKIYFENSNEPSGLSDNKISTVFYGRKNGLWIGNYEQGVSRYNYTTDNFKTYLSNISDPYSLSDNNDIRSIFEDETGMLWIGTLLGGVNKLNTNKFKFRLFSGDSKTPNLFINNSVRTLHKDSRGGIWIGTVNKGLYYYDSLARVFEHYQHDPNDKNSIQDNQIRSVYLQDDKYLWVGLRKSGVCKIDLSGKRKIFKRYNHDPTDPGSLLEDEISRIFGDKMGNIWVLYYRGRLCKYNVDTDGFELHLNITSNENGKEPPTSYVDSSNKIWIGSNKNVVCYDPDTRMTMEFKHDDKNPLSLPTAGLRSIYGSHHEDTLWIGTNGGLVKFNKHNGHCRIYDTNDGLANNTIYAAIEGVNKQVWMSTNRGLSVFDPARQSFVNFDISDGLQGNEYNNNAHHISPDGEIFFGGLNGFNSFYPNDVKFTHLPPAIALTELRIFNQVINVKDEDHPDSPLTSNIALIDTIAIPYEQNVISFEFTALNFSAPMKCKYAYRLEGFEEKWNYRNAGNRLITYTNLDPDEYVLRLKAANDDGTWGQERKVYLKIIPPFWLTTWFKAFMVIFSVLTVFSIAGLRNRGIRKQKRRLEQAVKVRTAEILKNKEEIESKAKALRKVKSIVERQNKELLDLNNSLEQKVTQRTKEINGYIDKTTHDLRGPISSLLGLDEIVKHEVKDKTSIFYFKIFHQQLLKVDKIILDLLELTKVKNKEIVKSEVRMDEVVNKSLLALRDFPNFDSINFDINIPEGLNIHSDEILIQIMIKNLLENGMNYSLTTEEPILNIDVAKMANKLCIKVTDNGLAIREKHRDKIYDMFFRGDYINYSSGLGMHITKNAVGRLKGEIIQQSKVYKGNKFEVLLPL